MENLVRRLPLGRLSLFGFLTTDPDEIKTPGYEELEKKYTGIDGIQRLFSVNEYGNLSPQLATATHMSTVCTIGGMIFGAFLHGKNAWINYMENNQATSFANHLDAKKKLQDAVTLAMGKGMLRWGWRIGGFSTICIFSNTMIAAYRGQTGIIEYVGAGAITGGLFKLNMGIRGLVAGTVVGAACGTFAGVTSYNLLKLTGFTMTSLQETQFSLSNSRNEQVRIAMKKIHSQDIEELRAETEKLRLSIDRKNKN